MSVGIGFVTTGVAVAIRSDIGLSGWFGVKHFSTSNDSTQMPGLTVTSRRAANPESAHAKFPTPYNGAVVSTAGNCSAPVPAVRSNGCRS